MRRRLLTCALFGLVGLLLAMPVSDGFGVPLAEAMAVCLAACAALGYVISIVADVFAGRDTEV